VVYAHSTISSKLLGFVVSAMRPTLPPGQAARRGHPAGERSPGDNCCKIAIAPRIKCSKTSFANLRHAGKFENRLLGPTNLSCIVAENRTFEALRLLWTVAYLGRRFLRADSQHKAATVEQARVESGYDEEVILLNRTR
jgi:hypothetical protein